MQAPARAMKCWCVHAARGGAMATPLSSPLVPATILRSPLRHRALLPSPPRAASSSSGEDDAGQEQAAPATTKTATADDDFEERVLRIKSRVGPKKRGPRRKKGAAASASANAVTLPPVPLREPRSALGAPVEFGFTAYSERLNGALAALGLAAVLLVELGSGQALVKYHQPATLFLQAYTVAAAAALFVKYEKERISTWPGPPPAK